MSTDLRITFDLLSNMATKYGYIAEDAETCGRAAPTELDGGIAQALILDLIGSQGADLELFASRARRIEDNLRALVVAQLETEENVTGAFETLKQEL